MYHYQATTEGHTDAIRKLPAGAVVKEVTVSNAPNILTEAKSVNPAVFTVWRKWFDSGQIFGGTVAQMEARVRDYYEQVARHMTLHVDALEEWNEYFPWTLNAQERADRIAHMEIAARIWRDEYRDRWPQRPRLILCNGFVWNDLPREAAEIAIQYDCLLSYHAYSLWLNGQRAANDWVDCSGRWALMEEQWGLRPDWIFTEVGPFVSAANGWQSADCLDGNRELYVEAMRQVIRDWAQTPAYREGRLQGFAIFTVGDGYWPGYNTAQPELNMLADMIAEEWHPGSAPPAETGGTATTNRYWNLRSAPVLESTARLVTLPPGTTLDYAGTTDGDEWNGSTEWVAVTCYLHSAGVDVRPAGAAFAFIVWPTDYYYLTQSFGANPANYAQFGLPGHEGVDIRAPMGTRIRAVADGTVEEIGTTGAYGHHVVIRHPEGYRTLYAHLSAVDVVENQVVSAGDHIGDSGNTGNSTAAHLHLGLFGPDPAPGYPGNIMDPTPYLLPFEPDGYL